MATLFRWLLRIASGLVILTVLVVLLVYYFAARSLPDYSENFTVEGITAPVEIVRDNADVPHIFGQSDRDVFYALGFAHAQDRLWQMTMLRRTAQGRLSELFGEKTLRIDMLIRRFDLYGLALASVEAQDEDTQIALQAYADGVNAWLTEVNAGARGRGAPEMWLFNQPIAPWQPADSIAILKVMALQLSSHLEDEVLRARLSLMMDPARVRDLMPDDPGSAVAALPERRGRLSGVVSGLWLVVEQRGVPPGKARAGGRRKIGIRTGTATHRAMHWPACRKRGARRRWVGAQGARIGRSVPC